MKKLLIIILTTISFPVCAGEYVQDGFSCISKDSFNEMTKACVRKDSRWVILERGLMTSKVRAYLGNRSIILYTNSENVK
jgi:hypothetical protein